MHGRPRKAPTQEEQKASSLKAAKLRELQSQVLHFHHNKIYTKEAIELSAKLLESNPEHYTFDSETIQSILDEELRVVENALKKNFKSYGAWHHRKWVLSKGHSSTDKELKLLGKFQKLDSRNFHAWNYRRFITALKKIPDEEELQYTTNMIYDNFSNYSAWHNRSVLLSKLLDKQEKGYQDKENVLGEEYEFVRNALFTDPDDQSGWFYHLWLLDQTLKREPLFLSSWPPHGSNLYISHDGYLNGQQALPVLHFQSKVKNSSTVTVECEHHAGGDLNWTPLSANKCGFSPAWLTCLTFPDEVHSLEACPVTLSVAHFPGITSSSGMPCSQTCHVYFTVSATSGDQEHSEVQTVQISWNKENFKACATESQEENLLKSLCKLEIRKENKPTTPKWSIEAVSNEIAHCQELLSSTDCKIGKLTLARLLMARVTLISYGSPDGETGVHYEDILALYHDLMKMDPRHLCYYEDEYSLVLLKQVTSNMGSLLKHCCQYRESSSPNAKPYSCLRLNGLSLSRFGSMEHLLWVQMLDLSHNKLRSVEGLEPLQLLSCLKLSNNRICNFTALEPLKMLKSLQVLDISNNEIGAHTIDTRRYLCSSPLTHAVGFEKFTDGDDVECKNHWEAYLLFKDLNLLQLEIVGNAVVDEQFKAFLAKLMPALKWLDGEKCH
ncbi:Protein geranylgeranyltransferase type II, alpha subunit [Handroanthus impetiginosus]|uniref:Geranylgeranyl transferase type-2 subunit alpha n=1 Tax=Handroanthus impetiginosus TaxID=429701 RepID=A0A2G9FZ06_9LAMI|nr:Protein geranylgeranyltransferase type II, alpha subunit [Handroanthus impetiginosus]